MADTMAMRDSGTSKPILEENCKLLQNCGKIQQELYFGKIQNGKGKSVTDSVDQDKLTAAQQQLQQVLNTIKLKYKYNYVFASPRLTHIASQRLKQSFKYRPSNTIEGKGVYTFTGSTKKEDVYSTPEQLYEFKNDIITRNDITIWLGDLNYRIGGLQTRERVFELLAQSQQTTLLTRYEQLLHEKDISGTIFHGFKEGKICFPPSYKYDVGSQTFDSSQKSRIPSWTDRILFIDNCSQCFHELYQLCDCYGVGKDGKSVANSNLQQPCLFQSLLPSNGTLNTGTQGSLKKTKRTGHGPCQKILLERYGSVQTVSFSDHKPVFAHFFINVGEGK
jgi:hypothetical protein